MRFQGKLPDEIEAVARTVVDSAFRVHTTLGPGLLESVYEACIDHEIRKRGLGVQRQVSMPIVYDTLRLESGLRLDMVVDGKVVVEIKAVDRVMSVHKAQLLSYLRLSGLRLGLLVNFNVPLIRDGIERIAL